MKQCKDCKNTIERNQVPKGNWVDRYADATGRLWNGLVCPDCKNIRDRKASQSPRKATILRLKHKRLCRECNELLPAQFYFYHPECRSSDWEGAVDTETHHLIPIRNMSWARLG